MTDRGAVEAKAYVVFKMIFMEKCRLENTHVEDGMEKHRGENCIKYKYKNGTYL